MKFLSSITSCLRLQNYSIPCHADSRRKALPNYRLCSVRHLAAGYCPDHGHLVTDQHKALLISIGLELACSCMFSHETPPYTDRVGMLPILICLKLATRFNSFKQNMNKALQEIYFQDHGVMIGYVCYFKKCETSATKALYQTLIQSLKIACI